MQPGQAAARTLNLFILTAKLIQFFLKKRFPQLYSKQTCSTVFATKKHAAQLSVTFFNRVQHIGIHNYPITSTESIRNQAHLLVHMLRSCLTGNRPYRVTPSSSDKLVFLCRTPDSQVRAGDLAWAASSCSTQPPNMSTSSGFWSSIQSFIILAHQPNKLILWDQLMKNWQRMFLVCVGSCAETRESKAEKQTAWWPLLARACKAAGALCVLAGVVGAERARQGAWGSGGMRPVAQCGPAGRAVA
jgi:hypothetical protein